MKLQQDGKVSAFRKSEPIPEENNEAVKVVVGDNFEDIVLNSPKNGVPILYHPLLYIIEFAVMNCFCLYSLA